MAIALFLLLSGIYALSAGGHTYSSDEEGMLATTRALLERGSPELVVDETNDSVTPRRVGRDGMVVGVSGLGQSLVAVPLHLLGTAVSRTVADGYAGYTERLFAGWTNAVVTAAGAVIVFLLAELLGARRRWAVAVALTYGLATMAWPHAKTFFSEPLATTLVLASAYCAARGAAGGGGLRSVAWAGAFAGAALVARTSAGLFVPVIGTYLLVRLPRRRGWFGRAATVAAAFAAGAAPPVAFLLASNWWRFGSPFDLGYEQVPLAYPVLEGLYGLFLSPGKGLFLYAPAVAVGLAAVPFAPARRRPEVLLLVTLGLVNALFFARFVHWHGDHSWGPRYLVMSLPFLVLPVAPLLGRRRWRRALAVAAAVGFLSAALGTVMYFNQYFHIAQATFGDEVRPDGSPYYWDPMHYEPYWSPVAGHVRALPDVVENSLARLDGEEPGMQPFPGTTADSLPPHTDFRYAWYFAPPQLDSWAYWLFPTHGPKQLLLVAPLFAAAAVAGGLMLRRGVRTS